MFLIKRIIMALEKINDVKGKAVFIAGNDIDTDRIIPARFMVCVTFEGLGKYAFYDERKNADGTREHAPQSLWHYGFRAIVAESFAEIFFGNSTTLGIPCVCVSHGDIAKIGEIIENDPEAAVDVNLDNMTVSCKDFSCKCSMPDTARAALVSGTWDPIAELLDAESAIKAKAESLPYFK